MTETLQIVTIITDESIIMYKVYQMGMDWGSASNSFGLVKSVLSTNDFCNIKLTSDSHVDAQ